MWRAGHRRQHRVKPALKTAVQRVVVGRLPVRAVRRLGQRVRGQILNETGMPTFAVMPAVFQVCVGRQLIPRLGERLPALDPGCIRQLQGGEQIGGQQQAQPVLAQRLGGGFLCGGDIEHGAILLQRLSAMTASGFAQ